MKHVRTGHLHATTIGKYLLFTHAPLKGTTVKLVTTMMAKMAKGVQNKLKFRVKGA